MSQKVHQMRFYESEKVGRGGRQAPADRQPQPKLTDPGEEELTDEQLYRMDRLDLIFQKQPREIQDKLMRLLIGYNAVMQYNSQTDMFEVDLLLPFLNETQKRDFIRQFLLIRSQHKKDKELTEQYLTQRYALAMEGSRKNEVRKFSFNNNYEYQPEEQQYVMREGEVERQLNYEEEDVEKEIEAVAGLAHGYEPQTQEELIREEEGSSVEEEEEKEKPLDLKEVGNVLAISLEQAINKIKMSKAPPPPPQAPPVPASESHEPNNSSDEAPNQQNPSTRRQSSIIDQMSGLNSFETTQKFTQSQKMAISELIKEDIPEPLFHRKKQAPSSQHAQSEPIQEQEEEEPEPLFKDDHYQSYQPEPQVKPKVNNDKGAVSFEDYTKQYASMKQKKKAGKAKPTYDGNSVRKSNLRANQRKVNNKPAPAAAANHNQVPLRTPHKASDSIARQSSIPSHSPARHQRQAHTPPSASRHYHSSPSRQTQILRHNIEGFFQSHKQNMQRLYSNIRHNIQHSVPTQRPPPSHSQYSDSSSSDIRSERSSPNKSLDDLYILVEDDSEDEDMREGREAFKSEVMKEYQREILVKNRNLSSEDLVSYFKYLHSNAKKLYLKYLKSAPK